MSAPALEVRPTDPGYATLYQVWLDQHKPVTIEQFSLGNQYRVIHPTAADTQPTFVLMASAPLTDRDADGPPGGYAQEMGTRQSSFPGRRLPLTKT